jgi:hypothetical protein
MNLVKTSIERLAKISPKELTELKDWIKYIHTFMTDTVSSYAVGRKDLHLRHNVKFIKSSEKGRSDEVTKVSDSLSERYKWQLVESIGERLLPGFHQALVLYYPKGTSIRPHRDSRAYDTGAATINIVGNAKLLISPNQDPNNMESFNLEEGDQIRFNNKELHAISEVKEDRWCVCFFYIKDEFLPKKIGQLELFPNVEVSAQSYQYVEKTSNKEVEPVTETLIPVAYPKYQPKPKIQYKGYSWKGNPFSWWNLMGEEISFIINPITGEKRTDIKDADDIPDGWNVILAYGGRKLSPKDLILISTPNTSNSESNGEGV